MNTSSAPVIPCNMPWKHQPVWGPAGLGLFISRMWRWRPEFHDGYTPVLRRISLRAVNNTTGLYDAAVAPEWWVGFLDVDDDPLPSQNVNQAPLPAALIQPLASEPQFFELAGVFALVTLTNGGTGFDFPLPLPQRHAPALVYARNIGDNCRVRITPLVEYVRNDIREREKIAAMV